MLYTSASGMLNRVLGSPFFVVVALLGAAACGKTHKTVPSMNAGGTAQVDASGGSAGGSAATGGVGAEAGTSGAPAGTGGAALVCPGTAVTCVDAGTAQFCDLDGSLQTVVCKDGMATEGFVSSGCTADAPSAPGNGCTVDAFLDPDCQAGTPPFAVCVGATRDDLLDIYAACFTDLNGANDIVSCYRDYLGVPGLVDCEAAQAACSKP